MQSAARCRPTPPDAREKCRPWPRVDSARSLPSSSAPCLPPLTPPSSCRPPTSRCASHGSTRRPSSPAPRCFARSTRKSAAPTSISITASSTCPFRSFPATCRSASCRASAGKLQRRQRRADQGRRHRHLPRRPRDVQQLLVLPRRAPADEVSAPQSLRHHLQRQRRTARRVGRGDLDEARREDDQAAEGARAGDLHRRRMRPRHRAARRRHGRAQARRVCRGARRGTGGTVVRGVRLAVRRERGALRRRAAGSVSISRARMGATATLGLDLPAERTRWRRARR